MAASCEQRGKSKTNKDGCHPASVPIETFFASTADAFPGDNEWTNPLKRMKRGMAEATRAAQEGNLTEVHEVLEDVVIAFEELREKRNLEHYLDSFSRMVEYCKRILPI